MADLIVLGPAWVVYGYNYIQKSWEAKVFTKDKLGLAKKTMMEFPDTCLIEYVTEGYWQSYDIGYDEDYEETYTETNRTFTVDFEPYPAA